MQRHVITRNKKLLFILCLILGWTGAHHFYLRRKLFGIVYIVTFGLFGVGWFFDLWRLDSLWHDFRSQSNANIRRHDDMKLLTLILGFTGIQHFMLKRHTCGIYFLLTFGGVGIGWITDVFRIHVLTESYNLQGYHDSMPLPKHLITDAFIYCFPLGFLGLHHFYLSRPKWGIFYLLTLGNFGVGWIVDLIRLKKLVEDSDSRRWDNWDAFILWFPLGLFGAHWWYLENPFWAATYAVSLGYLGIGWLIDIKRIPIHVKSLNRKCMLAGIMLSEADTQSLQWDDSEFSAALLPREERGVLSFNPRSKAPSPTRVHLSRLNSRTICLDCGGVGVCLMPCTHFSLCAQCIQSSERCPRCNSLITGWATVDM